MKIIVFALRRPDMNHWTCEGHGRTPNEALTIVARLRNDPKVFTFHVCEDLDHDIDGMVPMTADEVKRCT